MRWLPLLIFLICINVGVYILASANLYTYSTSAMPIDPDNLLAQLGYQTDLTVVIAGIGVGATVGGILAYLTRQYVFGAVILLIWVLGMIAPVLQWVFTGLPTMLDAFGAPSYITLALRGFIFFTFFMGILEVASQRNLGQ